MSVREPTDSSTKQPQITRFQGMFTRKRLFFSINKKRWWKTSIYNGRKKMIRKMANYELL